MTSTAGIHHVTGIAGDAQRNVDFYAGVLGLRLVKVTVNFDDPRTYHLYYGDGVGSPGSIITFFPWPRAKQGRAGVGQVAVTTFAIPLGSIGYWLERFVKHGVAHDAPTRRMGEPVVAFRDRDGLQLELAVSDALTTPPVWSESGVSADHAIRGIHGVTLWENRLSDVEAVLTEGYGFQRMSSKSGTTRFTAGETGIGRIVDIREVGGFLPPIEAGGTIHHVAFRAATDAHQLELRERLVAQGLHPTEVLDRKYFHSVYTREPGGVLFEIATDAPGFAIDESAEQLGSSLQLPSRLEAERATISARLPALHPPLMPPLHEGSAFTETNS